MAQVLISPPKPEQETTHIHLHRAGDLCLTPQVTYIWGMNFARETFGDFRVGSQTTLYSSFIPKWVSDTWQRQDRAGVDVYQEQATLSGIYKERCGPATFLFGTHGGRFRDAG